MRDFTNKLVLVTGAGSGIGRATALAFARRGARLALVDLREEGVLETAARARDGGREASAHLVDVSDADAVMALASRIEAEHGVVDVLVNNAGIGAAGRFLDTRLETFRRVMDVNLMGVVHGCRAFLPSMVARGQGGHVVNTASLAGYVAAAEMPAYATSKFAVVGFSESLRADMARHGIGVTAICPGIIDTDIVRTTVFEGVPEERAARGRIESFYRRRGYGPDRVAENLIAAVEANTALRPISPESWAMYYAKRLVPGLVGRLSAQDNPFVR